MSLDEIKLIQPKLQNGLQNILATLLIATAAVTVVAAGEKAVVPVLAFLLIIITVFIFEPLYNLRKAYERIASRIPSILSRPLQASKV